MGYESITSQKLVKLRVVMEKYPFIHMYMIQVSLLSVLDCF